jgi:serine/threonine protein kinase
MRGFLEFPDKIQISEKSKDFIQKCLTIEPAKRITWKAIYEHPLLSQSQSNTRQAFVSMLSSKVRMDKNK